MEPKILLTLGLEDQGQDFTTIDVLENGVMRGYSILFSDDRLSLLGVGTLNGTVYTPFSELGYDSDIIGGYVYFYRTTEPQPLPWKADTFKYKVISVKEPK